MRRMFIRLSVTMLLMFIISFIADQKLPVRAIVSHAKEKVAARINSDSVTEEDLDFYKLMNRIQLAMNREADQKRLKGKHLEEALNFWDSQEKAVNDRNTLLTQVIRLHAAALLAKEKGYTASDTEVKKEIAVIKQTYRNQPAAMKLIKGYGEKRFWNKEFLQYQLIVLSKKVRKDVLNKVKQANPKAEEKEITFLANKKYEELLISQIGTLKISFVQ